MLIFLLADLIAMTLGIIKQFYVRVTTFFIICV